MNSAFVAPSRRNLIAGSASFLALGGCGSLLGPSNPPLQIYRLDPSFPPFPPGPRVSWQLAVARPYASQTLDTERIPLIRGAAIDYYADAQWTDSVPRLVQSLLVEAFERSGRILAVGRESEGLRADFTLVTDIREFDAQYTVDNAPPTVIIDFSTRLLGPHGTVVALQEARQSSQAAANSIPSVIQAFNQASGAALAQIVAWALQMHSLESGSQ